MTVEVARFQVDPRSIIGIAEFAGSGDEDEHLKGIFFERVEEGFSKRIALIATNGAMLARFEDANQQGDLLWSGEDGYFVPTARIVPLLSAGLKSVFPSDTPGRRDPVTVSITEEPPAKGEDKPIIRATVSYRGIVYTEIITESGKFPDYRVVLRQAEHSEAVETIALDAEYVGMFEGVANKIKGHGKTRNYIHAFFAGPDRAVVVRMRIGADISEPDFLALIMPARQEALSFSEPKKAVNE